MWLNHNWDSLKLCCSKNGVFFNLKTGFQYKCRDKEGHWYNFLLFKKNDDISLIVPQTKA